jgi:hypothetical protein
MSDEDENYIDLQQDSTSAGVERAIGQIGTAMGDATVVRNGFTVVMMFDEVFVPDLIEHICKSTVQFIASEMGRNAVTNVQEEDEDEDHLYDVPELCQRGAASPDSDFDDSDK